ncbi:hypothetical protein ILUMI_20283 [Ignelater luminosus]|uniref:Uncharacterized protein n=1 Tax=Ignelater luminosus TaxID=2038154 RepID=A0A8K0CHP7_IGNLU|nr:hypothetical protein ILUMI_20283 [Ignelater luminosus]
MFLFGDDQIIIASYEDDVDYMLRKLKAEYENWDMKVNMQKTGYLRIGEEQEDLDLQLRYIKSVRAIYPDDEMETFIFVQHNSSIHTVQIVQACFDEHSVVELLHCCARSADLNPIENLWTAVVREWDNVEFHEVHNVEELICHITTTWEYFINSQICDTIRYSNRKFPKESRNLEDLPNQQIPKRPHDDYQRRDTIPHLESSPRGISHVGISPPIVYLSVSPTMAFYKASKTQDKRSRWEPYPKSADSSGRKPEGSPCFYLNSEDYKTFETVKKEYHIDVQNDEKVFNLCKYIYLGLNPFSSFSVSIRILKRGVDRGVRFTEETFQSFLDDLPYILSSAKHNELDEYELFDYRLCSVGNECLKFIPKTKDNFQLYISNLTLKNLANMKTFLLEKIERLQEVPINYDAYHDATADPHGYLLFDLKQSTPNTVRYRTSIFPEDGSCFVYVPRKVKKHSELLRALCKLDAKERLALIKSVGDKEIHCVCECVYNTLKGKVPLSTKQKAKLARPKSILRK